MAEEAQEQEAEVQNEQGGESEDGNPVEALAKKLGWNPNYDGENKKNAEEFILNSRAIQDTSSKQNKMLTRKLVEMENTLTGLDGHYKALYKAQITQLKREVGRLKQERKEASEDGDHVRVQEIDNQIKEMSEIPQEPPTTQTGKLDPDFVEWADENAWYDNDTDLRQYADFLGTQPEYKALYAAKGYKGLLTKITKTVKEMFPDKFEPAEPKTKTRPAASVESGGRRAAPSKTKLKYSDLTREQQDMCDTFVKRGIMTREKYLEDLETISAS